MLIEDEHGTFNLVVPPPVYERYRAVVRGEPLVLVHGRLERVGRNQNVLVERLETLGPLARRVSEHNDVHGSLPDPHSFGHR
jgi:error-prone DNA polymerase